MGTSRPEQLTIPDHVLLAALDDGSGRFLHVVAPPGEPRRTGFPWAVRHTSGPPPTVPPVPDSWPRHLVDGVRGQLGVTVSPVRHLVTVEVMGTLVSGWQVEGPRDGFTTDPGQVERLEWLTCAEAVGRPDLTFPSLVVASMLAAGL